MNEQRRTKEENRCLFCNEVIPEGRQICPACEKGSIRTVDMPDCLFTNVHRGDIFMADLNPVVGSETGGFHPVVVIQNDAGNKFSPTTIAAIGTSAKKPHLPVHVKIRRGRSGLDYDTIVQLEQIRTIDKRRLKQYIGHLPERVMKRIDKAAKISIGLKKQKKRGKES